MLYITCSIFKKENDQMIFKFLGMQKNASLIKLDEEWGFETPFGDYINPKVHAGSVAQFCQCPGPNEVVTVAFTPNPNLFMTENAVESCDKIRALAEKVEKKAKVSRVKSENQNQAMSVCASSKYAALTHGMQLLTLRADWSLYVPGEQAMQF